ncbi:hypothetical protein KAR50_04630 [Periweissella fabaria]|uniref:dUTPase n=1 Tax=Periweissella fabaria TaxID=546157 RepID=A0ABM8Z6T6_9LACO|nr:hypothetical protein [Periweissella fabaria]MCM0597123.1 hypothetical protein [Periweissella fabaria]CAH0417092.1 hypothetical protein WFA24289_01409 [Periweissella fabaria]
MLDTSELLRISRMYHRELPNLKGIRFRGDDLRKICYENLDIDLAKVADVSGWFKFWEMPAVADYQALLSAYVQGLDSILWLAQVEQWMHLVVIEPDEINKLSQFPHGNLNNHYLGLKTMAWNCYLRHSQSDYKHLLKSYLKLGLVELQLVPDDIMQKFNEQYNAIDEIN